MVHQETTQEQPHIPDDAVGLDKVRAQAYEAAALGEAAPGPGVRLWLLAGLKAQEAILQATVLFFQSTSGQQTPSDAAEWMLDNFYLAQQSLRQIREDMPQGFFYRQLPKLAAGSLAGYPRIYDVAQQLVADSGAQLDMEQVQRFVWLYQDIRPLTTGELWALPVMLRLSILAALAQAAGQITNLAQQGGPPSWPLSGALTGDEIVANCFTSLRTIATHDWREFFEHFSRVEQILRGDPADVYAGMDRATRDQYRKVIEELALASGRSELEVARMAVALTQAAWSSLPAMAEPGSGKDQVDAAAWPGLDVPLAAHVGYYLLDDGRTALEEGLGYRPSPAASLARVAPKHPAVVYLGPIAVLTLVLLAAAVVYAAQGGSAWLALLAAALVFLPALAASVTVVDWVVTLVVPPRILPKLDLSGEQGAHGIPDSCRTLVVAPAMLTSAPEVASLVQQIEQHYLRNSDHNLFFALLTDFGDAQEQYLPGDAALLDQARVAVGVLNARYGGEPGAPDRPFCMFHRARRWNAQERRWIGWERKRGKLHELNRWLRGATAPSIMIVRAFQLTPTEMTSLRYRRILVPSDGSQRAECVLPMASTLARFHEAQILLVHVVRRPEMRRRTPPSREDVELADRLVERNRIEAIQYLDVLRSQLLGEVQAHVLVSDHVAARLHVLVEHEMIDLVALSAQVIPV
jgi:cyclic beta-1,2-glucan synthetase